MAEKTLYLGVANEFNDPYDAAFWIDYRKLAAWEKLDELGFSDDQVVTALASDDPIAAVVALASAQEPARLNVDQWLHEVGFLAPNHQARQLTTLTLWPVAYTEKLFDITHIFKAHRLGKDYNQLFGIAASLCKAVDWQYECEWRWVIPDGDREVKGFKRRAPLKAVHLGAKNLGCTCA